MSNALYSAPRVSGAVVSAVTVGLGINPFNTSNHDWRSRDS